jgi:hypothetical protein
VPRKYPRLAAAAVVVVVVAAVVELIAFVGVVAVE